MLAKAAALAVPAEPGQATIANRPDRKTLAAPKSRDAASAATADRLSAWGQRLLGAGTGVPHIEERSHWELLREVLENARAPGHGRDPAWQQPRRQLEKVIRTETVAIVQHWQRQGLSARDAAALLHLPPRTMRAWQHTLESGVLQAKPLGRPHARCTLVQQERVTMYVHGHGPWVGLPTLASEFPEVARAELRDLLLLSRYVWGRLHPRACQALHWHRAGTVWAMDFAKAKHLIDGRFRHVFTVRDLASGLQLAWRPVADQTAATALSELTLLFVVYGAPLVLKSDNGSAFRAGELKQFLRRFQVWPLYSPPGCPGYNGAIEASIGSLKKRTDWEACRAGHAGLWTSSDLERAREQANTQPRPQGPDRRSPLEAWESRRPPSPAERDCFADRVQCLEAAIAAHQGIAPQVALNHYEQAALHRVVLQEALVEGGYLSITRRLIPQTFYGQKAAKI